MRDLKLTLEHDLHFNGFDFEFVVDTVCVAQRIKIRLLTIAGEYKWNYLIGVDWFDGVFDTETTITQKNGIIRSTIAKTEGVQSLQEFQLGYDPKNRSAMCDFIALSIYGPPIEGSVLKIEGLDDVGI